MLNTSSGKNHELKKYSNSLYISKYIIKNFSDSNELLLFNSQENVLVALKHFSASNIQKHLFIKQVFCYFFFF